MAENLSDDHVKLGQDDSLIGEKITEKLSDEHVKLRQDDDEFIGYIHNISPLKKDRYFDFELQGKSKTVCGVCFSPPKLKKFSELIVACSPVQIKKFRVDTNSNSEDYLMGSDFSLEPFPEIDFANVDKPTKMDLSTIKSLCPGQTVTVIAKVSHLYPSKCASNNAKMQNGVLVDPSGTMKVTLWHNFVGAVKQGGTYSLKNFKIYKDKYSHEICMSMAVAGSEVEKAAEFKEVLALSVSHTTATHGEIVGVEKISYYLACRRCGKKVEEGNNPSFIECNSCHLKQKQKSLEKHWFALVAFEDQEDNKIAYLTMFEDLIVELASLIPISVEIGTLTQAIIEDILYKAPDGLSVSYNRRSKVFNRIATVV